MVNLSPSEQRALPGSIFNDAILPLADGKPIKGLIAEITKASEGVLEKFGHVPSRSARLGEFYVPFDALDRALVTNVYSGAGAFVATDLGEIMPAIRAASVVIASGAQVFTGLKGNFSIPREVNPNTFSVYPEVYSSGDISSTDLSAGQVNMSPNRGATACLVNRQLDVETGGRAGQFVLASMARGSAALLDNQALTGSGVAGNSRGIVSTSGTASVTFSGTATLAKALSFESQLLVNNIESDSITFVAHPSVKAKWKGIPRFAGTSCAETLWDSGRDYVCGHPARTSTYLSATSGFLAGDFSKVAIGTWGDGLRVCVNPFLNSMSDKITYICEILFDIAVLRAEAFCLSNDSAVA
jgi:HK97 family phage major capsid protein